MGLKAKVKATGEVFDIEGVSLRLTGKVLSTFDIDEVEVLMSDSTPIYWTRLEHQYAGMAMQGLVTRGEVLGSSVQEIARDIAEISCEVAHALVEKMKENEKAMH